MLQINDETGAIIPSPEEVLEVQEMAPVLGVIRKEVDRTVFMLIINEISALDPAFDLEAVKNIAFRMSYI